MDEWLPWVFELAQVAVMAGAAWWARGVAEDLARLHRQRRVNAKRRLALEERLDATEQVVLALHAKVGALEAGDGSATGD